MPRPKPSADRIAAIVADAEMLGAEAACKKHKISASTLRNYRKHRDGDVVVADACAEKRKAIAERWLEQTEQAREKLLARVVTLAESSTELRDVVGAFKIVTDANLAEKVVTVELGESGEGTGEAAPGTAPLEGVAARLASRSVH